MKALNYSFSVQHRRGKNHCSLYTHCFEKDMLAIILVNRCNHFFVVSHWTH